MKEGRTLKTQSKLVRSVIEVRPHVVIAAAIWWFLLAVASRLPLSSLQESWSLTTSIAIIVVCPVAILLGLLAVIGKRNKIRSEQRTNHPVAIYLLFALVAAAFILQCTLNTPPLLAANPNEARLAWGLKFVHVISEITIRAMVLTCLGTAVARRRFSALDGVIVSLSLAYTILVVSRSFTLEIFFYCAFASWLAYVSKRGRVMLPLRHVLACVCMVGLFVLYGEWRQEAGFSIVSYGKMLVNSTSLAWIYGYFLVNFDNLAMVVAQDYQNKGFSNVLGPLIQSLQIAPFDAVDAYPYVGRFNLGTALRPFLIDFGLWTGVLSFALFWYLMLSSLKWCKSDNARTAIILYIAYCAFCFPISGRLEQPPYLLAFFMIIVFDQFNQMPFFFPNTRRRNADATQ